MATISKETLILKNDLEGCYERFQTANARWKNHWWAGVEEIYNSCKDWAKKFVLDPIARTLEKIKVKRNRCTKVETGLYKMTNGVFIKSFVDLEVEDMDGTQKTYFFQFYTKGKVLLFNKVGMTAKTCLERLKQEIKEYCKTFDIEYVEIHKIYDCGEYPAEGFESYVRAYLIKKYPRAFKQNDRFFSVTVDPGLIDELWKQYCAL